MDKNEALKAVQDIVDAIKAQLKIAAKLADEHDIPFDMVVVGGAGHDTADGWDESGWQNSGCSWE